MLMKRECSVTGCVNLVNCRNLCKAHYHKFIRYGTPFGGQERVFECSVSGCGRIHYGKGFCSKHYKRFKIHGDPLKVEKGGKKFTFNKIKYLDNKTIQMELPGKLCCLLDVDKYDLIKNYRWCGQRRKSNPAIYVIACKQINGKKHYFRMSRLIMDCPIDKDIDHIGGSDTTLDNRIENLRVVNKSQNNRNRSLLSNNLTGHKNIYLRDDGYCVQVRLNKKLHTRGCFSKIDQAIWVRNNMLKKLHGDYSRV